MFKVGYSLKSGSRRRRYVRVPGGVTKVHYSRFKVGMPRCGICGSYLNGVVVGSKGLFKASKSERSVERPYGGYLCHKCLETLIKLSVRV
ncbi:MAG: 50S ribosomal protein L34e [Sulfolobales archaeon]